MILKNLIAIWTFILKEVFIRRMDVAWYVLGPFSFIQLTKLWRRKELRKKGKMQFLVFVIDYLRTLL